MFYVCLYRTEVPPKKAHPTGTYFYHTTVAITHTHKQHSAILFLQDKPLTRLGAEDRPAYDKVGLLACTLIIIATHFFKLKISLVGWLIHPPFPIDSPIHPQVWDARSVIPPPEPKGWGACRMTVVDFNCK